MPERTLPLMEMFPTVQGEGFHQGKASFFIRLAGCDVGCPWCDVKESWDVKSHPVVEVEHIIAEAKKYKSRIAVITGGEPFMHDLTFLTSRLKKEGFSIHIETSGAYPFSGQFDWVTLSPKKFMKARSEYFDIADELKVIIVNKPDFTWSEKLAQKMGKVNHKLFIQPEWDKSEKMVPQMVEFVKEHPEWEISLQMHKFMNIP